MSGRYVDEFKVGLNRTNRTNHEGKVPVLVDTVMKWLMNRTE